MPVPATLHDDLIAVDRQRFDTRFDGALLETIGRVVYQFSARFQGPFEQAQELLFDEFRAAVFVRGEQFHEPVEVGALAVRARVQQRHGADAAEGANQRARSSACGCQKSKKLNQLYGSLRQYRSSSA